MFYKVMVRLRLGRGAFSCGVRTLSLLEPWRSDPRQLPVVGPRQKEFTTRRAAVLFTNSLTLGFSLVPPLCLWQPKKPSRGSWQIF